MNEDGFAISLLSVLFVALKIHAIADDPLIPVARTLRLGMRLRRFIAWEELRATIRRKFAHRAPPMHLRTGGVPMPERPDSRWQ